MGKAFKIYIVIFNITYLVVGIASIIKNVHDSDKTMLNYFENTLSFIGFFILAASFYFMIKNNFLKAIKICSAYLCFYTLLFLLLISFTSSADLLGMILGIMLFYFSGGKEKTNTIFITAVFSLWIIIGGLQTIGIIPQRLEEIATPNILDRAVIFVQTLLMIAGIYLSILNVKTKMYISQINLVQTPTKLNTKDQK